MSGQPPVPASVPDAERMARALLGGVAEGGEAALNAAVDELGAAAVVDALRAGRLQLATLPRSSIQPVVTAAAAMTARLPGLSPQRWFDATADGRSRFVVPGDGEWPALLDDLGPYRPYGLWLRGPARLDEVTRRAVAVVGSRAATGYGTHVASELGYGLAERLATVVSGAAYGVDGSAHRGCLAAGGTTVAVLGCGVDLAYPAGNARLLDRIVEAGLVVSEVPPGTNPTRVRFLVRNRVVAGLAGATVVVEAGLRSGALSTAARAVQLGRPVAAVPGPVTSAMSAGCHALLREGAVCVTDAAEALELAGRIGDDLAPERRGPDRVGDDLGPDGRALLDAFPSRGGIGLDGLAVRAGLPVGDLMPALGALLAYGLVRRTGSGWQLDRSARRA